MDREMAEQLAAGTRQDLTADDVHDILEAVLGALVTCNACSSDGVIDVVSDVDVEALVGYGQPVAGGRLQAGSSIPCPRCGGASGGTPGLDRTVVAWVCGDAGYQPCGSGRPIDGHDLCGWKIVLPLPGDGVPPKRT